MKEEIMKIMESNGFIYLFVRGKVKRKWEETVRNDENNG